jgi:altronate hydrolase
MQNTVLQLDPRDNVLVALRPLRKGDTVSFSGGEYTLLSDIPAKHKFVTRDLVAGEQIIMYGGLVGTTSEPLRRGDLLSTKNLRHAASDYHSSTVAPPRWTAPDVAKWRDRTFLGYHRADGQVGTRNHWLVVPLVFCENRNLGVLKQAFEEELGFALPQIYRRQVAEMVKLFREGKSSELKDFQLGNGGGSHASTAPKVFKNIDGIKFLTHEQGCGSTREDTRNLCGILAGYIHHPNVAGVTVLSLGCQHAQTATLVEEIKKRDPNFSKPLLVFDQQQMGEESKMLSKAIHDTFVGMVEADKVERKPAPLSKLVVGLKCGGSDGFSGISANPAIGHTADLLAALGGRGILSEFPELCGVEQQLIDRSVSREVGDKYMNLMREIAEHPNVYCKLSGMVTEADWKNWKTADFEPYLDVVFDAFGAERLMFGSDWPVCLVAATYSQTKNIVESYVDRHLPSAKSAIFGENVKRFYGIELATSA